MSVLYIHQYIKHHTRFAEQFLQFEILPKIYVKHFFHQSRTKHHYIHLLIMGTVEKAKQSVNVIYIIMQDHGLHGNSVISVTQLLLAWHSPQYLDSSYCYLAADASMEKGTVQQTFCPLCNAALVDNTPYILYKCIHVVLLHKCSYVQRHT